MKTLIASRARAVACLLVFCSLATASAADLRVAVAANFLEPAKEIAVAFERRSGHKAVLSAGATGQLVAQIMQGAPFDVFLAADQVSPARIAKEGIGDPETQFTYAIGRLVLYSKAPNLTLGPEMLASGRFERLAIANPVTAPYGLAAMETLQALKLSDQLTRKLVTANTIAQTFQFVDTGNAELGFVASSQMIQSGRGSQWLVPESLHSPIAQDAILLRSARRSLVASDFLSYLKGSESGAVIERYGYRRVQ